jgi:hypothetical protein
MNVNVKKTANVSIDLTEDEAYVLFRVLGNMPTNQAYAYANTIVPNPPKRNITYDEIHEVVSGLHYEIDKALNPHHYDSSL